MSKVKVLERYIYPIKSFPGIRLTKMEVTTSGPVLDRQWMLVDDENKFLSLRQRPDLTLFRVSIGNFVELTWKDGDMMDFGLSETEGDSFKVSLWDKEREVKEVSGEVSEWISSKIDKKVKLVRMTDDNFVDKGEIMVVSKASLDLLDMKVGKRVAISRFRPNLIIDHVEAHEEDVMTELEINNLSFQFVDRVSRCRVIQVNPITGEVTEEPMKTLSTYRKEDGKVYFGSYFRPLGSGTI